MNSVITETSDAIDSIGATAASGRVAPLFLADWCDLVFMSYEVDGAQLQREVPLELDRHEGRTYVSLVTFTQRRLRPSFGGRLAGWMFAPIATHEFLNLRAYVRVGKERGIYFLSEWISNRLALLLGPGIYGLPYNLARIEYHPDRELRTVEARVTDVQRATRIVFRAEAGRGVEPEPCELGSLNEFLLERYVAFTRHRGRLRMFRIWHEPWRQLPARLVMEDRSLATAARPWFEEARFVGCQYSPGVRDVWIGRPQRVDHRARKLPLGRRPLHRLIGWFPLVVFPSSVFCLRSSLPAWAFMWAMAFAIFAGCKWLTWWQARDAAGVWRSIAYLLLWPGMDARAFLDTSSRPQRPALGDWLAAAGKTALGPLLIWGIAPIIGDRHPLMFGWTGMFGLIFLLHFGTFQLLALVWRMQPIMDAPLRSRSLSEFWGRRWNAGFHQLAHEFVFRPMRRRFGAAGAILAAFVVSGIIHELVISLPAHAGYGLPTGYFALQGLGVIGQRRALRNGLAGRLFTLGVTAGPVFWLFHPPFVERVIVPFLRAIGAT